MVFGLVVDLSALLYLLRTFPSPYQVGVPGRLVLVGSNCASRRRAVNRGSVQARSEMRVGVGKVVFGQAFRSERTSEGVPESEASAPVGEAGRGRKRAPFLLGQAFRSEIGSSF